MRIDLFIRYWALPDEIQRLIREDMETALERRIEAQERIAGR